MPIASAHGADIKFIADRIGLGQSQYQKSSVVTFVSITAKTFRRDPGIGCRQELYAT